jgi:hypothetical protein
VQEFFDALAKQIDATDEGEMTVKLIDEGEDECPPE